MATNKKTPAYVAIAPNVFYAFQLDKDIYTAPVCTALGITLTEPTSPLAVTRLSIKAARRTGNISVGRATVRTGTGETEKTRQIRLLCDREKTGTAQSGLKDKTVVLGDVGTTWTISNINFG